MSLPLIVFKIKGLAVNQPFVSESVTKKLEHVPILIPERSIHVD